MSDKENGNTRGTRAKAGRRLTLVAIAALLVYLFAAQFGGGGTLDDGVLAPANNPLPRVDKPHTFTAISEYRGQVVVLDFWSTTCAPCMSQMKVLEPLQRRMGARGVQVVGVCAGGEPYDEVQEFVKKHGAPYPMLLDANGVVTDAYRVRSLPTLYVIDPEGRIAASHVGFWPESELARAVAAALEAPRTDR